MRRKSSKKHQLVALPTFGFIVNIFYAYSEKQKAFYASQNQHGSRFERIDVSELEHLKIISDIDEMHSNDMFDRENY